MMRTRRTIFFVLSASCYTASLLNVDATSTAQSLRASVVNLREVPRISARLASIDIRRDPFAGEPAPPSTVADRGGEPGSLPTSAVYDNSLPQRKKPTQKTGGSFDFVDGGRVPDIGADVATSPGAPDDDLRNVVLKATIVGRRAVAYVLNGSVMDIVRVGDRLGTRTILRIELSRVVFGDGSHLDLGVGYRRDLPRASTAPSRSITIEDLRKALEPLRAQAASPPTFATPTGSATPGASGYPTPGPLPTVDQRGFAAGSRPTFDPAAPTPYPVPGIDR